MRTIDKRLSALESTRYANAHAGAYVVDTGDGYVAWQGQRVPLDECNAGTLTPWWWTLAAHTTTPMRRINRRLSQLETVTHVVTKRRLPL